MEVVDLIKVMIECGHTQHLTRERSLKTFTEKYTEMKENMDEIILLDSVFQILRLMFQGKEWELRYGAIRISVETLNLITVPHDQELFKEFKLFLFEKCRNLFVDEEFRVRNNVGDIMQKLIEIDGSKIYEEFKDFLFQNIRDNFKRDPKGSDASSGACKFSSIFVR